MGMIKIFLEIITLSAFYKVVSSKNSSPVLVGVILQPSPDSLSKILPGVPKDTTLYVIESYINQISSAGGVPVLVPFDLPQNSLRYLLDNLQILLLPGGPTEIMNLDGSPSAYQNRMHFIIKYAKERNDNGRYFPILATCQGFQNMLVSMAGQNLTTLQGGFNNTNVNRSVIILEDEVPKTKLFSKMYTDDLKWFFQQGYAFYNHDYGILQEHFMRNQKLVDQFFVVGLTKKLELSGRPFVTIMEHKKYPFIANLWHPEKNPNEKGQNFKRVDRSRKSISATRYILQSLVESSQQHAVDYKKLPAFIEGFYAWSFPLLQTNYTGCDRIVYTRRTLLDSELNSGN
jgi:hypothetical protein